MAASRVSGASPVSPETVHTTVATDFPAWRDLVAKSFVPLTVRSEASEFRGRIRSRALEELSIVEITANGQEVLRTPDLITRSERHYFKFNLQLSGHCVLSQDNREARLAPGDLALCDTGRPYTLVTEEEFRTLVIMFPWSALGLPPDAVGQLTAVPLAGDSGLGRMISPFMVQLAENLEVLNGASGRRLAYNAVDLIATLLEHELDIGRQPILSVHDDLLQRIRQYIEAHLGDPGLSPCSIAAAHYISTRQLHTVFREMGITVSDWIRTRRLELSRRDLGDPFLKEYPVGAIARRWGFIDASHFSRTFRSNFGQSPRAFRNNSGSAAGGNAAL